MHFNNFKWIKNPMYYVLLTHVWDYSVQRDYRMVLPVAQLYDKKQWINFLQD